MEVTNWVIHLMHITLGRCMYAPCTKALNISHYVFIYICKLVRTMCSGISWGIATRYSLIQEYQTPRGKWRLREVYVLGLSRNSCLIDAEILWIYSTRKRDEMLSSIYSHIHTHVYICLDTYVYE